MSLRLYSDEDAMRAALVTALRNSGIDVMTAAEANRLGDADEQHLRWATEQQRVLYSFNVKDFSRIHNALIAQEGSHAGIIVVTRQGFSIGQQLQGILRLMAEKSETDLRNQLVYLSNYIAT